MVEETITEDAVGQAFVSDPRPSILEQTEAAILEGNGWLALAADVEEPTEDDVALAETLRALIEAAQFFGQRYSGMVHAFGEYLNDAAAELA